MLRILLFTALLLVPFSESEARRPPKGCVRLRNGRLRCKIKGIRRNRSTRKQLKAQVKWPLHKIRRMRSTQSIGLPFRGILHRGRRIPTHGKGYIVVPRTIRRGHFYGTKQLIGLIRRVSAKVNSSYKRSLLTVGDLSARRGGRIVGHRSHQNGRDVDMGFYLLDRKNRYRVAKKWFVGMDSQAIGKAPNNHLVFDLERNWELVEAMITDKTRVELILISGALRTLLINYAEAVLRPAHIIKRAKAIMKHYPNHDDHFHVRIACPKGHLWCNR